MLKMLKKPLAFGIAQLSYSKNAAILQKLAKLPVFSTQNFSQETSPVIEDSKTQIEFLLQELNKSRNEGRLVPDPAVIKPDQWEYILTLKSRSARWKYYSYLYQVECHKRTKKAKKEKKKLLAEENPVNEENSRNTMFLRICEQTMNKWKNLKLVRAMQFGQKIVIDCDYDDYMVLREAQETAKQLMRLFGDNRLHEDPFDIHFCNANYENETMKHLLKRIPSMKNASFPMNVHKESYLNLFPKESLVYLTPHCGTDLKNFCHDDVYIIGAIVDKSNHKPLSMLRAEKQGLRMARLPLDSYLDWASGRGKYLAINQMLNILYDLRKTGDWNYALKHVPQRKLKKKTTDESLEMLGKF